MTRNADSEIARVFIVEETVVLECEYPHPCENKRKVSYISQWVFILSRLDFHFTLKKYYNNFIGHWGVFGGAKMENSTAQSIV